VNATRRGHGDSEKEAFIEVVEYSDGVTICAVYAREARPGGAIGRRGLGVRQLLAQFAR